MAFRVQKVRGQLILLSCCLKEVVILKCFMQLFFVAMFLAIRRLQNEVDGVQSMLNIENWGRLACLSLCTTKNCIF